MIEYFWVKHKIDLKKNAGQPVLIIHKLKQKEHIYLPVSECYSASLPEGFTEDFKKMKDIGQYRISDPNERFDRYSFFVKKL